jgi:hypothetical protein
MEGSIRHVQSDYADAEASKPSVIHTPSYRMQQIAGEHFRDAYLKETESLGGLSG